MELISLASGASYFASPMAATEAAISALKTGHTFYGPTEGTTGLRQAICNKYKKQGIAVNQQQVLITPGSKQALFNLFSVLLRQGDEVVVPTPAWFGFHELMKYSCGKLVPLETKLEEGYALTADMLQKSLNESSRILLLTNPGNPTGRVYTKAELEELLEVTNQYPNLYTIADEIYDHITYGNPLTPLLSCKGAKKENILLVSGYSKSFAMSGWRIGYIVGPEDVIQKCADFQGSTLSGVSVFLQEAAQATLEHSSEALAPMAEVLQQNRELMRQALTAIPRIDFYYPDGAYYFFPDFSAYLHKKTEQGRDIRTTNDLCAYLEQEYNLVLAPGDNFGAPGHARMSFAVAPAVLQEALQRLQKGLAALTD